MDTIAYTKQSFTGAITDPDADATWAEKIETAHKNETDKINEVVGKFNTGIEADTLDGKHLAQIQTVVSNESRVADFTGDGIPLIPDNIAGWSYIQDDWATLDSWSSIGGNSSVLSVANKTLTATATGSKPYCGASRLSLALAGKMVIVRVRSNDTTGVSVAYDQSEWQNIKTVSVNANEWQTISGYVLSSATGTKLIVYKNSNTGTLDVDFVYIGSGLYDSKALDRSGNGNDLTLTAVTPVNGKFGEEMSFNGASSFARALNPVIGTTGTIAIRFKRYASDSSMQRLVMNSESTTYTGMQLFFNSSNYLTYGIGNGTTAPTTPVGSAVIDTNYHIVVVTITNTLIQIYFDGVQIRSASITPMVQAKNNLFIGCASHYAGEFFNGIISHFRYDSRIWTADEIYKWNKDPSSTDSRVRPFKEPFATKLANSPGEIGDVCYDANYRYFCVAANSWKRIALSSF